MRFCLVSTQEHHGGGEVLLASIAAELAQTGHTVGWVLRGGSEVAERIEGQGGKILHQVQGRGRGLADFRALRLLMKNWSPDLLVMNDTHAVVAAGLAAITQRRVSALRLAFKHTVFPLRSKLKYRWLSDKVICVSQAARSKVLAGGLERERTHVVYGGAEHPRPSADARARIRSEFGLKDGVPLLVAVGNLLECKGHQELVTALAGAAPEPKPFLVIAGEGQQRDTLEQLIASVGLQARVKLLGFRSDVQDLLAAADLVVHPSHAEGLSLVLIQAQMLAKPIVATAVGGAAEVLGDFAAQGEGPIWEVRPQDADHLAQQIGSALKMLALKPHPEEFSDRMAKVTERAFRKFSIAANTAELVNVVARELLAEPRH